MCWEEHLPLLHVERHRENLLCLRGLRLDCGWEDELTHIPRPEPLEALILTWT